MVTRSAVSLVGLFPGFDASAPTPNPRPGQRPSPSRGRATPQVQVGPAADFEATLAAFPPAIKDRIVWRQGR